jgi:hypothetical protein
VALLVPALVQFSNQSWRQGHGPGIWKPTFALAGLPLTLGQEQTSWPSFRPP